MLVNLLPLPLGALLAWTGGVKLPRHRAERQVAGSALERVLPEGRWAVLVLRAVGLAELVIAAALLVAPAPVPGGIAAATLGFGFVGYLAYGKATAPDSSCGCASTRSTPITARTFGRAALVVLGGVFAAVAHGPWGSAAAHNPLAAVAVVAVSGVVVVLLSSELDGMWLLPLRRSRLRVLGHPLSGLRGADVPLAATVQLLESSLAWQSATHIVRSGLIEHWDSDGWRILRYTGRLDDPGDPRPVSVLFALDASATTDSTAEPAVRVTVVDEEQRQAVGEPVLQVPKQKLLPLAKASPAGA